MIDMLPFGQTYAAHYDLFYGDKDYETECDLLESAFGRFATRPVETILDLGCGTGGHAFPLAARGYRVTGVDRSAEMLLEANRKLSGLETDAGPEFHLGEIGSLALGRAFDVATMMFAVLGYQSSDEELKAALGTVRTHLRSGGLFLADFWYGPAVLAIGPSYREMRHATERGEMVRTATPSLDVERRLCTVRYQLYESVGERRTLVDEESHTMRFFSEDELTDSLDSAAMQLRSIHPFPLPDGSPDETTWNAWLCAAAR